MLFAETKRKIAGLQVIDQIRKRMVISKRRQNLIVIDGEEYINFCSNDYLSLANHLNTTQAFIDGVQQYGFGSGSSPMISGYFKAQQQLEEDFAEFLNRDRALYFNSGYQANLGVIPSLVNRHDHVISDRLCHASIIDSIVLSRAKSLRYRHNDTKHLQQILAATSGKKLVITEGVFSMEGDIAPLDVIARDCSSNNALLVVDDAHAIGVLGRNGGGSCEHFDLKQKDVSCLVVPLGKAFCAMGGMVAGANDLIEAILQSARSYIYSTALPPAVAMATIAAIKIIGNENWRRARLGELIVYFIKQARSRNLPLISADPTPIMSFLIGDNYRCMQMQQLLMAQGFYISAIRPPTVPPNGARIRITLNCNHSEQEIQQLLDLIGDIYERNNRSPVL